MTMLSTKSGIKSLTIVAELVRYCIGRQYIQQGWDLLQRYPDTPASTAALFPPHLLAHSHKKHFALLLGAVQDIVGLAGHVTSHPPSLTQAQHLSVLAAYVLTSFNE